MTNTIEFENMVSVARTLNKKQRYEVYKQCRKLKFSGKVLKLIRILNNTIDKEIKENAIHK